MHPIRFLTVVLFLSTLSVFGSAWSFANSKCSNSLTHVSIYKDDASHIPKTKSPSTDLDGVPITGEASYSTPLILTRLGFDALITTQQKNEFRIYNEFFVNQKFGPETIELGQSINVDGKIFLSLGEGYSGLTPFLRTIGGKAFALDLWYGRDLSHFKDAIGAAFIKIYNEQFKEFLISGDATNLKNIQSANGTTIQDNSVDYVVSHMMFDYLSPNARQKMIQESLRVLKPNGEIRIYSSIEQITAPEVTQIIKSLKTNQKYGKISMLVVQSNIEIESKSTYAQVTQYRKNVDSFDPETFQSILKDSVRPPPVRNTVRNDRGLLIIIKKHD